MLIRLIFYFCVLLNFYSSCIDGTEIPAWMIKQISQDLAPFRGEGIREYALSQCIQETSGNHGFCRFKIIDNKIFVETKCPVSFNDRIASLKTSFRKLTKKYEVPNVDFIVCLHDASHMCLPQVPLFVFAKKKSFNLQILMPDFEALAGYQRFSSLAYSNYPWQQKIEKGLWRGAPTGGIFTEDQWRSFPRSRLVLLSLEYPDWIDARFTSLSPEAAANPEMMAMPQLLGNYMNPDASLQFKYLIDVDGNSCAYSRCYWILLSDCLSIKQVTDNIQWYYGAIKPYEHYLPVEENLGDLFEKIQWAREHDEQAHEIARRATQFALDNLQEEHIYLYLFTLLQKYAELQNFKPNF